MIKVKICLTFNFFYIRLPKLRGFILEKCIQNFSIAESTPAKTWNKEPITKIAKFKSSQRCTRYSYDVQHVT